VNPEEEKGRAVVGRICRKGRLTVNGPRHVTDASAFTRRLYTQTWASAHRSKWGQLTPPGKMDKKLKSENMQKRAVFCVCVIF